MVAAGATVLMAASEESSSNGTENKTNLQCGTQAVCSRYNEAHSNQQTSECSKKDTMPCPSNAKSKSRSQMLEKNSRLISRQEKDNPKSPSVHKTTPIRETKASRLRAASIISPNGGTLISRRLGTTDSSSFGNQPSTSVSPKDKNSTSDPGSITNSSRERDKSHKRKSYLNRSHNIEAATADRLSQSECRDRQAKRQSNKQGHISETISSTSGNTQRHVTPNSHKKSIEPKMAYQRVSTQYVTNRPKTSTSPSISPLASIKYSNVQRTSSGGHSDSEVSRRVDALTALTKATMERVERLASHSNLSMSIATRAADSQPTSSAASLVNNTESSSSTAHPLQSSPRKCSILKKSNDEHPSTEGCSGHQHAPVSILKHKPCDGEQGQTSSGSTHPVLPVTFSPSVVEPVHKRHGILKKRSSLDESEILRRRSCSPDVSFMDNSYSEFRPILKNQRRSSLDEIIKRDQSPDPQPTSILKRKSSREDDREDRQLGFLEPQGILKKKSASSARSSGTNHYVTITTDTANAIGAESLDGSEVRPILKKKHSREEPYGNDPVSVEPRPILKKKSSTESDEHDDKPKKTILKCSRKNSQDESNYEAELTSPKKLSMLRNRTLQSRVTGLLDNDPVRPILKQPGIRDTETRVRLNLHSGAASDEDARTDSAELFLRKRAQSVGHVQPSNSLNEFAGALNKRRSLELTSVSDILQERSHSRSLTASNYLNPATLQSGETASTSTNFNERSVSSCSAATDKYSESACTTDRQVSAAEPRGEDLNVGLTSNPDESSTVPSEMTEKECKVEEAAASRTEENDVQSDYEIPRSNSVSKMTMHFKALQEKSKPASGSDGSPQRTPKVSRGIQRYRERKVLGSDRFNTQPVTMQEVQEAVLQNQRNASSGKNSEESTTTTDDEFDPSKLSLAERVRLFNQKIATEKTPSPTSQERHPRRRPATRYKTQPVTSEEVEVASRIPPLTHQFSLDNSVPQDSYQTTPSTSQGDLPRSILKPIISQAQKPPRSKSPELEGLKLIKSVLKRESEELSQQVTENCDSFPRSILKTNNVHANESGSYRKSYKQASATEQNHSVQQSLTSACERSNPSERPETETKQTHTVPSYKNTNAQDELPSKPRAKSILDEIDNAQQEHNLYRKQMEDSKALADEACRDSDDDSLSSGAREVHSIIKNEVHRRHTAFSKQAKYASLAKSASHHALSSETHETEVSSSSYKQHGVALPGLYRSATQTIPTEVAESPGMSIADRLAALQRSGNTNWKRRIGADSANSSDASTVSKKEELSIKQGVLADCIGKLESATEGWKKRIIVSDATKFTVAGKMKVEQPEKLESGPPSPLIEVTGNISERKKKTPRPERFRARKGYTKDAVSMPTSPNKDCSVSIRGSFSEPASDDSGEEGKERFNLQPTVSVPKADDETFTAFFTSVSLEKCEAESVDLDESVFDMIASQSELLVSKRNVRIQKRKVFSKNPIKALAARTDLRSEYTEVRTGVAEKVMRQLNVEKLAKNSPLAIEALAGLASTEDFSAVTLRNATESSISAGKLQPYKDVMLILIKGRRHVQVRLVEPSVESLNSGDNFVLVTRSEVYNFVGKYSNVIEKVRGAEIAMGIQQNKDLGCQASHVITINEDKITCTKSQLQKFWGYLGTEDDNVEVIDGGHPEEDELYESAMIDTNMVYEIKDEELVPLEKYWGALPKIEMLQPNKVLVFDFGSEMYIWSGKLASANQKRIATQLATEMWREGYDYTECAVCPINAASLIGRRPTKSEATQKCSKVRPDWCLLAKLTQHMETVLFREKFLDWPNVSGIIRVRGTPSNEQMDGSINIEPCNVDTMLEENTAPVDFVLKGSHLGRGIGWYDDDMKKQSIVVTSSVTMWHIDEFSYTQLDDSAVGQFYTGDSYIIRWMFTITITGRELSGLPSKHSAKGRDRSVFFIWQGQNASLNEQGAAALLTVELDNDQAPQIRVVQGHEPAVFLNLFAGGMIVHSGKKMDDQRDKRWRLYICLGTLESEVSLLETPCSTRQLRSRGSLVLIDTEEGTIYVWHGSNALPHIRKNAFAAASKIKKKKLHETGLSLVQTVEIVEIDEGNEPEQFFTALRGMNKKLYVSLPKNHIQDHTPRLFHFSSISKEFKPVEILCPHRAELPTPFPFLQEELYQVNQPALFLLDNNHELWIWQGWWPDTGAEDQSGSKSVRWQAERRAAMTVAMQYWQKSHPEASKFPIYLVWAGLEPLQFINLFPTWTYRDDIAKLNIEDGRNPGEVLTVENELARLTQSTYPPAQLLQRPLPEGVDPTRLELYLSHQHFQELLGMSQEEFQELPIWKQMNLKKEIGLF